MTTKTIGLAITATLLGACATVAPPLPAPQSSAELAQFATTHVTTENLPADTKRVAATVGFKPTPDFKVVLERADSNDKGNARILRFAMDVKDLGGGLVREITEQTANGLPWGRRVSISAHGWNEVKTQFIASSAKTVALNDGTAVLSAMQGGFAAPKVGDVLVMETSKTPRLKASRVTCTVESEAAAKTLHTNLPGKAQILKCDHVYDGVLGVRTEYAYLADVNFALLLKSTSTERSDQFKIVDFKLS
jgi:hypothetical protein